MYIELKLQESERKRHFFDILIDSKDEIKILKPYCILQDILNHILEFH